MIEKEVAGYARPQRRLTAVKASAGEPRVATATGAGRSPGERNHGKREQPALHLSP